MRAQFISVEKMISTRSAQHFGIICVICVLFLGSAYWRTAFSFQPFRSCSLVHYFRRPKLVYFVSSHAHHRQSIQKRVFHLAYRFRWAGRIRLSPLCCTKVCRSFACNGVRRRQPTRIRRNRLRSGAKSFFGRAAPHYSGEQIPLWHILCGMFRAAQVRNNKARSLRMSSTARALEASQLS